jgi:hypothetical protein
MSWSQKEKVIREKRTIEATKKNLMGPAGKIGIIVRALGDPIMAQGGSNIDTYYLEDPFEDFSNVEYEKTLSGQNGPVAWTDDLIENEGGAGAIHEDNSNFLGYVFDGLSRGIHIEIQYIRQIDIMTMRQIYTLKVHYKGYEVYKEVAGELDAYAPFPEWEDLILRLYKNAKEKHKSIKDQEYTDLIEVVDKKKASFLDRLRMRWGV